MPKEGSKMPKETVFHGDLPLENGLAARARPDTCAGGNGLVADERGRLTCGYPCQKPEASNFSRRRGGWSEAIFEIGPHPLPVFTTVGGQRWRDAIRIIDHSAVPARSILCGRSCRPLTPTADVKGFRTPPVTDSATRFRGQASPKDLE